MYLFEPLIQTVEERDSWLQSLIALQRPGIAEQHPPNSKNHHRFPVFIHLFQAEAVSSRMRMKAPLPISDQLLLCAAPPR
jgi:hypothetical protein